MSKLRENLNKIEDLVYYGTVKRIKVGKKIFLKLFNYNGHLSEYKGKPILRSKYLDEDEIEVEYE